MTLTAMTMEGYARALFCAKGIPVLDSLFAKHFLIYKQLNIGAKL